MAGKIKTSKEFIKFLVKRKRWWLIPVIVILLVLGIVLVFAESSALAPLIYTLF